MEKSQPKHAIENFKAYYRNPLRSYGLTLSDVYHDGVVFVDPVHRLQGLDALSSYFEKMFHSLKECRFEYLDEVIGENSAYIKWDMHFHHPRISSEVITLRGVTHIGFDDKITYHEDFYDMGSMLYEHLPVMGRLTRYVKSRVAVH